MPRTLTSAALLVCTLALGCAAPASTAPDEAPSLPDEEPSALAEPGASAGFEEDAVRQCALGPTVKGADVSY